MVSGPVAGPLQIGADDGVGGHAAGGVAANTIIRSDLQRACDRAGYHLYLPPLRLCGDNGAMIGAQGYYEYLAGRRAGLDLNAYATMELDDLFY